MEDEILILKEEIARLPKEVQDYIASGVWLKRLRDFLSESKFSDDQKVTIEREVFLVLTGLTPIVDLAENIEREAKMDFDAALMLAEDICENILGQADFDIQTPQPNQQRVKTVAVGFERAVLNQAKAMRPIPPAPRNLPVEEGARTVHDYGAKTDPYREPVE